MARPPFDDFVVARGASLIRFGYVLTGDHHLAEDIVQEVLARMHRRWSRMDELEQPDLPAQSRSMRIVSGEVAMRRPIAASH